MSEENSPIGDEIQVDVLPTVTGDRVTPVDIQAEMQRSYLDYAMAVIIGRALPDVRDGMKPVHRRIVYAMYDGGYLPNRSFSKSSRVVGEVMGLYHPHGDTAIYDALVRLVQEWTLRYPLSLGQGNFGSPGNEMAAAQRYTEIKMAPLALEMVRDIREGTVDFQDNYDGRNQEPTILPSRFPNLLVNGSSGIAVGMATNIPPHNLVEIAEAVQWCLKNPEAGKEEILEQALNYVKGPDFPTGATIIGRKGIEDVYRTGHGSIIQRAVVEIEEIYGRVCLVVTELPYQVNPDNLAIKIADLVKDGKVSGIADIRDETSGRTGQRLVIVLKKDAIAKVVLNNLYKLTQLQENFSANMLAIVDGVPRTLTLDAFLQYWLDHQIEVIVRRTNFRLRKAEEEIHILRGLLKALESLDEVIRLIRSSQTTEEARKELIRFLGIDELQANAILDMQLRRLAALERQKIIDQHNIIAVKIEEYNKILASEVRQREIVGEELQEIVDKFGDERRTRIIDGFDVNARIEDLIAEEEMVVTITRGGYVKRTRSDNYRSQARGGKGIRGAQLRGDDVVQHFFVTTTHHWLLFFTNLGRVYRIKAYELLEAGRDAKGQHIANLLPFLPDEKVAQVLDIKDYKQEPYLVLATRNGLVKKSRLEDYDSNRSGGVIAVNLRDGDEVVSAALVKETDDLLLVSRKGRSIRFSATDTALRPLARATSGVTGMKFRGEDKLLAMDVIKSVESPDKDNNDYNSYVFIVTGGGYAKRSPISEYRVQERGGLGVRIAKLTEDRGDLVGAMIVSDVDEVLVIMEKGKVVRSSVAGVPAKSRNTIGVIFAKPDKGDRIMELAKNSERNLDPENLGDKEEKEAASSENSDPQEIHIR